MDFVRKDLFFYLHQMKMLTSKYSGVATSNGKVSASAVSGTVRSAAVSGSSTSTNKTEVVTNNIKRCQIGNYSGGLPFFAENPLSCCCPQKGTEAPVELIQGGDKKIVVPPILPRLLLGHQGIGFVCQGKIRYGFFFPVLLYRSIIESP